MTCTLAPSPRSRASFLVAVTIAFALAGGAAPFAPVGAIAAPIPDASEPLFVPGQLLVQFRDGTGRADRARAVAQERGRVVKELSAPGLVKVELGPDDTIDAARARFARRPDVEYAIPNLRARASFVPNDSLIQDKTADLAWNLRSVRAYEAWDLGVGDPGVVLAIVDTGVAYEDHEIPDYERAILWPGTTQYKRSPDLPGPFVPGWDFVHDDPWADDDSGHGTTVATIAAGAPNNVAGSAGIAFGITIMPVKVIDWRRDSEMAWIVDGIRFATDHGANVINLSLGFPPLVFFRELLQYSENDLRAFFRPLRDAVNYAQGRGVVLVAASGNFDADEVSLPAGYPGVIAVGATDPAGRRSSYSSYGQDLDLVAPGGDFGDLNGDHIQDAVFVLSIKPNRSEGSLAKPDSFGCFPFFGTSGAAPHVAGAVALLMSQGIRSQGAIEQSLQSTAIRPPDRLPGRDLEYGAGLIQLDAALRAAKGQRGNSGASADAAGALSARLLSGNPARGEALVSYRTARPALVRAGVYDVQGRLVRNLEERAVTAGPQQVRWDGLDGAGARVPSGVYFVRIQTGEGVAVRKVAFLR